MIVFNIMIICLYATFYGSEVPDWVFYAKGMV